MKLLDKLPVESIDLTLTSPPYCMGKEYEKCTHTEDFICNHEIILPKIVALTRPGGSICWQIGSHVKNNVLVPLDYLVYKIMDNYPDMILRNRIVWSFGHGAHLSKRFSGRYEVILWFTKGGDYHFDLDSVRIPQKYPGKRHYKGPSKGEYSGNPLGKNPSDVWEIPHVKSNHVEKTEHPCQFPIALAQRLIRSLCPKNGTVFDPYSGVGSTGAAAILENRKFLGAEHNYEYYEIAANRLKDASNGCLKHRPLDKPICEPAANERVTQKPEHFA